MIDAPFILEQFRAMGAPCTLSSGSTAIRTQWRMRGRSVGLEARVAFEGGLLTLAVPALIRVSKDHPAYGRVLQAVAAMNMKRRLARCWVDLRTGTIGISGDLWVMDATPTPQMFERTCKSVLGAARALLKEVGPLLQNQCGDQYVC